MVCRQDVHHGNGTQHILEDDPTIMYMSLHRYDGCARTALQIWEFLCAAYVLRQLQLGYDVICAYLCLGQELGAVLHCPSCQTIARVLAS